MRHNQDALPLKSANFVKGLTMVGTTWKVPKRYFSKDIVKKSWKNEEKKSQKITKNLEKMGIHKVRFILPGKYVKLKVGNVVIASKVNCGF